MSLLPTRSVLLAKIEGTPGTDPTPAAASDAVLVENLSLSWPVEVIDRNPARPSLSPYAPVHGRKYGQITFSIEVKGSGAAGTAPEYGPLLRACALAEAISAGVSVTYTPASASHEYVTIWVYRDGLIYKFNGCQGNVSFNFQAGQRAMLNFTFMGRCVDPADATLASPTVDATIPPEVTGASFTINSYAAVIANLQVDLQNAVTMPDDLNHASGYGIARITGRDTQGSMDPEAVLVATHDFWSEWEDGTQMALSIAVGATAGNILTFTAPKVTFRELTEGERNGILTYELPFTCARNSGDDEISVAFT